MCVFGALWVGGMAGEYWREPSLKYSSGGSRVPVCDQHHAADLCPRPLPLHTPPRTAPPPYRPPPPWQYDAGDAALQRVADDALAREGLLLAVAKYTSLEARRPPPSLRVAVTAAHSPRQLAAAVAKLRASCRRVLG